MYNTNTTIDKSNEYIGNSEAWTYTIENLLTYHKTFFDKHRVSFTGLYSVQKDHNRGANSMVQGSLQIIYRTST